MEFEDDSAKAARNLKKHKVSFDEAASVFGDPMSYTFADPDHSVGEVRWLMFGLSSMSRVFAVIYTHQGGQYRKFGYSVLSIFAKAIVAFRLYFISLQPLSTHHPTSREDSRKLA